MRLRVVAITIACVALPRVALADDIPEVRVIGDRDDALQKVPGSGTVITSEAVERADPSDVSELLRRVPGIQARQDQAAGQRLDIGVRGLESGRSRRVLVLEDGIPIGLNPYAEPDLYYATPIARVRSVEVVKGSGTILFGPQTIGGVVNFVTIMPPDHTLARVDLEGGDYGYARGIARYGDAFGPARYIVQTSYERGDGFRAEGFESVDAIGKIAIDTSAHGQAVLKIGFHDDAADSGAVGLTRAMFDADPRRTTLTPYDRLHLRRFEVSLIHDQQITSDVTLRTLAYAYVTDRSWRRENDVRSPVAGESYDRIAGDPSIPGGAIWFDKTTAILDRSYPVAGIEPRVTHRITTGDVRHTLDYGARLLGEGAHYQQRTGENPTSFAGSLDFEESHRTVAIAGYAQDRIAFRDDLLVTPGVRVEHAAFHRVVTRQLAGDGVHDTDDIADTASTGFIPGIGMLYGSRRAQLFGGLHFGWAPPRVASSISPNGTPADLGGEESINYEVGGRTSPVKWLHADGTAFLSNFRNQIVLAPSTTGGSALAADGPTRHVGLEASATMEIGRALDLGTTVDLGARYNLARATFHGGVNDGNVLPYAPLQTFSTNLDIEHRTGFGGQIAYAIVGEQYTDAADTIAADASGRVGRIPTWHIVDLTAHYRHQPTGLSARITIKNALDDVYIVARRPEGIFAAGFRQVTLGLRWDYEREP